MNELSRKQLLVSYFFQVLAAAILAMASFGKFANHSMSINVFHTLGMDGTRLVIATIEGIAAILLFTKTLPHYGAILGFGTMLGALIAHSTVLGLVIQEDGGLTVLMLVTVILSTSIVMWIHRRRLPFIGHTID